MGRLSVVLLLALVCLLGAACSPRSAATPVPQATPTLSPQPPYPIVPTPTPTRSVTPPVSGTPTTVPTPSGIWRVENIGIGSRRTLEVASELISTNGTRFVNPKTSPDGRKVLFERYTGKYIPCSDGSKTCFYPEAELWTYSLFNARWLRLDGPAIQGSWSRDSQRIVYLSQTGPGRYDLRWIMAEGGTSNIVTQDVKGAQSYWWKQQYIVYLEHDGSIAQVTSNGSDKRVISPIKVQNPGGPISFVLSSDDVTLAVVSQRQVWLVPLDERGKPVLLTPKHDYLTFSNIVGGIAWSRNGRYVALSSGVGYVAIYDRDGRFVSSFSVGGEAVYSLSWSPEESALAVLSERRGQTGPQTDIVIANLDGSVVKPLGLTEGKKHSMDWSPTGVYVVWGSDFQQAPLLLELVHR